MRCPFLLLLLLFFLGPCVSAQTNCVNFDFEGGTPSRSPTSSVAGWTVSNNAAHNVCSGAPSTWTVGSNHFYLVSTPVSSVPVLGVLGHSPLGGTIVAQVGDFSGFSKANKLSRTLNVTTSNTVLTYAYASAMYYSISYNCCDGAAFRVLVRDCQGNLLNCLSNTLNPICNTTPHYTNMVSSGSGTLYTNWQVKQVDLSAHVNSCVTIEVIANDCVYGGHASVGFFDAICGSDHTPPAGVSFCPNGGSAILQAAPGYSSYAWSDTSGMLSANPGLSSYTVSNPSSGQTFTAHLTTFAGCTSTMGFVIAATQVSIVSIGASPSCPSGTSGSASVIAAGSGSGYSYAWTNATNSVVGTASLVANVAPGIYSVQVYAQNNSSCGVAGATVQVGNDQSEIHYAAKPFCGTTAYLVANGGSNFQWYIGNSAVTGSAGTSPSLTINSPTNGTTVKLEYTSAQGCQDTVVYTLWQTLAHPTVTTHFSGLACEGAANAQTTINLIPSSGGLNNGTNYFSVLSTGTTASFSSAAGALTQTTFVLGGLHAGGTYSVISFDGSCFATNTFTVPTFYTTGLYHVFPNDTVALCSGKSVNAFVYIVAWPSSDFTFSWSPLNFAAGAGTTSTIQITPTVTAGNSATLTYSVVITPTFVNCPITKTLQLVVSDPPVPVISTLAALCDNSMPVSASASPGGGSFSGGSYIDSLGTIYPQLAGAGVNTYSYNITTNGCIRTANSSFTVLNAPQVNIAGGDSLCAGSTGTLTANGASSYQWGDGSSNNYLPVNPATNTIYFVTGIAANGCSDSDTMPVFVLQSPTVTISGNTTVCSGEVLVLQAAGAQQLTWVSGPSSSSYSVYPATSTSYTVVGTNAPLFCSDTAVTIVTVHPKPVITVSGPDTVCIGELVVLKANGAENISWNDQAAGNTFTYLAVVSASYSASATNIHGCTTTEQHLVTSIACTGLEEKNGSGQIRVYPNPAFSQVTIQLPEAAILRIVDSRGRVVMEERCDSGRCPLIISNLAAGIYNILVYTKTRSASVRVVKSSF